MFKFSAVVFAVAALSLGVSVTSAEASMPRSSALMGVASVHATPAALIMAKSRSSSRSSSARRTASYRPSTNTSARRSSSNNSCSASDQAAIRMAVEPQRSRLLIEHPECRSQFPEF